MQDYSHQCNLQEEMVFAYDCLVLAFLESIGADSTPSEFLLVQCVKYSITISFY